MAVTMMRQDLAATLARFDEPWQPSNVREMGRDDEEDVLKFLGARPIHTVFMAGLIYDNGLISPRNRGSFYGCRNRTGQLEGVALIGHATLVEALTEQALVAFARVARNCQSAHLIRGEQTATKTFWRHYAEKGQEPRLVCSERLFELSHVAAVTGGTTGLRLATIDELEKILAVNSAMAFEEGGMRPLQSDPTGFRSRTARRIEKGRVWVWIEDNRLIFKADVVSETPEVAYLEGVYVHPDERGKGYGSRCVAQLSSMLLQNAEAICLTVNERNRDAIEFYTKAGFRRHSQYQTIYLH